MSTEKLAKVGDVIEHGQDIPGNVVRFLDVVGDEWRRVSPEPRWTFMEGEEGIPQYDREDLKARPRWFPLTVVEVDPERRCTNVECRDNGAPCYSGDPEPQPAEPRGVFIELNATAMTLTQRTGGSLGVNINGNVFGLLDGGKVMVDVPLPDDDEPVHYYFTELRTYATSCGIGIDDELSTTDEAGKATCEVCRIAVDEQSAERRRCPFCCRANDGRRIEVRDGAYVRHLTGAGGKCSGSGKRLTELSPLEDAAPSGPQVFEVPQPPPGGLEAVLAERAEAHEREVLAVIKERDDAQEWADRLAQAIGEHLGVDVGEHSNANLPWQTALLALQFTPSQPVVLRLPEVPEGAVALVGGRTGKRYTRPDDGTDNWLRHDADDMHWRTWIGAILVDEHPDGVTVEFAPPREPRTWPKLDDEPDAPNMVEVDGQGRFVVAVRRSGEGINQTTYVHEDDAESGGITWTLGRLREMGEVREVLDGGAS